VQVVKFLMPLAVVKFVTPSQVVKFVTPSQVVKFVTQLIDFRSGHGRGIKNCVGCSAAKRHGRRKREIDRLAYERGDRRAPLCCLVLEPFALLAIDEYL